MVKRCARDKVAEKLNQSKRKFDKKCYKELLEKKKLHCRNRPSLSNVFFTKGILKNLAKFTGKYLCQSIFFNKVFFKKS